MNSVMATSNIEGSAIASERELLADELRARARARAMVPSLKTRAVECEAAGKLSEATMQEFQEAGFFRICQPARWGASGMFYSHPLNRYFRDLHSGRGHVANTPGKIGRNWGAVLLGRDNTDFFL